MAPVATWFEVIGKTAAFPGEVGVVRFKTWLPFKLMFLVTTISSCLIIKEVVSEATQRMVPIKTYGKTMVGKGTKRC